MGAGVPNQHHSGELHCPISGTVKAKLLDQYQSLALVAQDYPKAIMSK